MKMRTHKPAPSSPNFSAFDISPKRSLKERQRRLYAYAEEIEIANADKTPLRPDLAKWLSAALKNIACGKDAEQCLNVMNDKTERKDNFLREMQRKHAIGFVAAATDSHDPQSATNTQAFEQAAVLGSAVGTIRMNWNKKDAHRDPLYTLTDT